METIGTTAALAHELQSVVAMMHQRARAGAGEAGVKLVVARRFGTFMQPERTEREWSEFWADYLDTCGPLPLEALEQGMKAWVALPGSEFLPKPGRLAELARTATTPGIKLIAVARQALDAFEQNERAKHEQRFKLDLQDPKRIPPTPEEREFVASAAAAMRTSTDARARQRLIEMGLVHDFSKSQAASAEGHAVSQTLLDHISAASAPREVYEPDTVMIDRTGYDDAAWRAQHQPDEQPESELFL